MKKLFSLFALLIVLRVGAQTLYTPTDPESLKISFNVNGVVRYDLLSDLLRKRLRVIDTIGFASRTWVLSQGYSTGTGGGGTAGVSSFNSRTGAVVPLLADYSSFYAALVHQHDTTTATTGYATKGYSLNLANGKVDKVVGKQLSTEDYTTAEKTKLAGVATGATNVTNNNQLTNGSNFITATSLTPYLLKTDSTTYSTKANTTKVRDSLQANINTKQGTLSFTTNGTSGPATLTGNALNIPNYTTGGASSNLLAYFNVVTYGADSSGVLDATSSIQAAINACVLAGGGTVYIPYARHPYKISGALQTSINSVNPNCQLYIPLVNLGPQMVTVKILGGTFSSMFAEAIANNPRATQGVILESTIQGTGTLPSVFGTPYANQGATGNRNYIQVIFENVIVRTSTISGSTPIAGTMSGINFARLEAFSGSNFKVEVSSTPTDQVEPTNETYGIICPDVGNKVILDFEGIVMVEGYKYGIVLGEHSSWKHLIFGACVNGMVIPQDFHSHSIQHFTAEACRNNILMNGTSRVSIQQYETEKFTSAGLWYTFAKDIAQGTGTADIFIFSSNVVISGVGRGTTFTGDGPYRVFNGAGANVTFTTTTTAPPPGTNLIASPNDFSNNTAWSGSAAVTNPDANTLLPSAINTQHYELQTISKAATATTYQFTIYARANGYNFLGVDIESAGNGFYKRYNLSTGTAVVNNILGTGWTVNSSTIVADTGGYYKIDVNFTTNTATSISMFLVVGAANNGNAGDETYTGNGTSSIQLKNASLL